MKLKLKISNRNVAIAGLVAVLIAAIILFGLTGFRTIAAITIFFFLPFYLILKKLNIDNDEKVFFAFFIGIGFFSTLVFYVGRVIPSYRLATGVTFIILLLIPLILKLRKR